MSVERKGAKSTLLLLAARKEANAILSANLPANIKFNTTYNIFI